MPMKNADILKERANHCSKTNKKDVLKGEYIEILIFQLAHEKYGIETRHAKEVHLLKDFTPLPCAPPYIFGLINVRRRILSVVDLKVLFGLPKHTNEQNIVVILQEGDREFGIISESFEGIQKIPLNKIQPTLPTLSGFKEEVLRGVTLEGIVILDGKKLFSSKQIIVDEMVEL